MPAEEVSTGPVDPARDLEGRPGESPEPRPQPEAIPAPPKGADFASTRRGVDALDGPGIDEAMSAEMDQAMRSAMDAAAPARPAEVKREGGRGAGPMAASGGGQGPAPIRGPRVVQAGREMRTGTVVSVGPTDVFVEFGPKDLGVVPRQQFKEEELPKVGDQFEVVVDHREADGLLACSRPGAVQKADWELLEAGQVVDAKVVGVNKGGLELEVANHRAFMPAGQASLDHIADLSVFVGEKLTCQVMRVDRSGRGNIVLSRREVMVRERQEQAEKLKTQIQEGQVLEGTVRKIMPFGAFVDLGGVDGLVHVSDLTHDRVGHGEKFVSRYVKEGERIKVQVLKVDWEHNRLSLGRKQVEVDPFAAAAGDVKEGAEVTGRVTKIAEFGAFVELAPGVEGLVHISELAWRRVNKVEDVVKPDEIIKTKVLKVDPESRRISLSLKALTSPPETPMSARDREKQKRAEEILKETPELRRLRAKFGGKKLKGGF
jgi:ribosomal protein S1